MLVPHSTQNKVQVEKEDEAWVSAWDGNQTLRIRREASVEESEAHIIKDEAEERRCILHDLVPRSFI